jgi:hypothetical protein
MFLGGSLISDKTFKKILSIGYEFETHDITKLSLHKNKHSLINSDLTLRLLKDKMDVKSITEVDNNYLLVRIPIGQEKKLNLNESVKEEDMDEEEREFMEAFQEEYEAEKEETMLDKLAKHENESYLEYFYENRKTDNKKSIKFNVTNDIGDGDFGEMVNDLCKKLTIPKNDMFVFKTKHGKELDVKFSEDITDSCKTFPGVEYVVTYYNPKKENPNVIIDTFVDACSRIIDHLADLKTITGTLMINDNAKRMYTPIGNIEDSRCLYRKPNTNLFYMDTYDDVNTMKLKTIGDVDFVPQMTLRCKALDLIEIMREILNTSDPNITRGNSAIQSQIIDLENMDLIEGVVDDLFTNYNDSLEKKIDFNTITWKQIKAYFFLIFYKLFYYIDNSGVITYRKSTKEEKEEDDEEKEEENYLKDFLGFASRHSNYELYKKAKEMIAQHYGIKDPNELHKILCQPEIVNRLYENREMVDTDLNEDGEFKYGDPANTELAQSDKNFGDPMYSFTSYFKHFEEQHEKHDNDWLKEEKIDTFSTTFDLTGDEILVENRSFRFALGLFLRNTVDKKLSRDTITVREMHKVVNALYGSKVKNMMNLEYNPYKKKLSRKCKPGYFRNMSFVCARIKSATKKKGKKLSVRAIKELKLKNKTKKTVKHSASSV